MQTSSRFCRSCLLLVSLCALHGGSLGCVQTGPIPEAPPAPPPLASETAAAPAHDQTDLSDAELKAAQLNEVAALLESEGDLAAAREARLRADALLGTAADPEPAVTAQIAPEQAATAPEVATTGRPTPPTPPRTADEATSATAAPTERERIFLVFDGEDSAALEGESLKFQAPVLKSERFEFAGTQEMEVLYASCDESIGTNAAARRDCQLRAANRIAVTQVLQLSGTKVDKDTWDVALEVWSPESNGLLWGDTLEVDAASLRLAARAAHPELASRYLCWRGVESACGGAD